MERAGVIARCLLRRLGMPLVEFDLPASRAQPLAHGGSRDAGADDGRAPLRRGKMVTVTIFPGDQHLALAAEARALLHRESCLLERFAHAAGDAPCRERRAGR